MMLFYKVNNFYSTIGQLKSVDRCLQKNDTLPKRYQETFNTDIRAGYGRKVEHSELNGTKDKLP